MGRCITTIQEIRWVTTDPDLSHMYVHVTAEGDCPVFGLVGWHHKAFPARLALADVMLNGHFNDYMLWGLEAPQ